MATSEIRNLLSKAYPDLIKETNEFHVTDRIPELLRKIGEVEKAQFFERYLALMSSLEHENWNINHQHARRILHDESYPSYLEPYMMGITGCAGSHCDHFICARRQEITVLIADVCSDFLSIPLDRFEIVDQKISRLEREIREHQEAKDHARQVQRKSRDMRRLEKRNHKNQLLELRKRNQIPVNKFKKSPQQH